MTRCLLLTVIALLASADTSWADSLVFVVKLKARVEVNDPARPTKTVWFNIDETDLVAPGNFLVVELDAVAGTRFVQVEEWRDADADGVPDTQVDRDPGTGGTQDIFQDARMVGLNNRKFKAVLESVDLDFQNDGSEETDGLILMDGRIRVDSDGNISGFSAKLNGVLNDSNENTVDIADDANITGSMKSVGDPL